MRGRYAVTHRRAASTWNDESEGIMRHHTGRTAMLGLALTLAVGAAPDATLRIALESSTPSELLAHINTLSSDEFEGRGPGTAGEEKAVAYVRAQFEKMGLAPGNPDGTYFQDVPLVGFQAKQVSGSFRAGERELALAFPDDFVAVSRRMSEH